MIGLSITSTIMNFPEFDYGNDEIVQFIDLVEKKIAAKSNVDWCHDFVLFFGQGEWIGVGKKGMSYPSTKKKSIIIRLPVPSVNQVNWGIKEKRFGFYVKLDEKIFYTAPPCYENFDCMKEWVIFAAKCGIDLAYKNEAGWFKSDFIYI